jgi:hypothetical protein
MPPARLNHDPGTWCLLDNSQSWTSLCGCLYASMVAAVESPPCSAMTLMCAPFELSSET